jgi:UDPglucose 6-dehydrogenase
VVGYARPSAEGLNVQIAVLGAGYVGLVAAVCFAEFGYTVTCVEKDKTRVDQLKAGNSPIFEPGLDAMLSRNLREGRLSFDSRPDAAVAKADAVFIAVGTPSTKEDGRADLTYVFGAAEEIAHALEDYTVIVNKSTVPVGTADAVEALIRKLRPDADFSIVSNPEFLREGAAISDFRQPDRIVIGVEDERARQVMTELYRPVVLNNTPMLMTGRRTSELIKYAANAFLAMKITFINEVADLCESVGANVSQVSQALGMDERIGPKFLQPGPGYGGFCFPKDTVALARTAHDAGTPMELVDATVRVNEKRKRAMADRVALALGGDLKGRTIAVLGLTFKANTDDMRESPSLVIVPALQAMGASVKAFDPQARNLEALLPGIELTDGVFSAASEADAVVILTEWDEFREIDLRRLKSVMRTPVIVDLRNLYDSAKVRALGFRYLNVGEPFSP